MEIIKEFHKENEGRSTGDRERTGRTHICESHEELSLEEWVVTMLSFSKHV